MTKYYSWHHDAPNIAKKELDLSVFKHRATAIPIDFRFFFEIEKMEPQSSYDIQLKINDDLYEAKIEMGPQRRTVDGREVAKESRLHWYKDFDDILQREFLVQSKAFLGQKKNINDKAGFIEFIKSPDEDNIFTINFINPLKGQNDESTSTWREAVLDIVKDLSSNYFTLDDMYSYKNALKLLFPKNENIELKIRQQLQFLRNDGFVEFVDNRGVYRRILEINKEYDTLDKIKKQVEKRNFRVEDTWSKGKRRVGTNWFRTLVLRNFEYECCICQLDLQSLLEASHIRPWREDIDNRLNPSNGLSFCRNHHAAFDAKLFQIKKDRSIIVKREIRRSKNEMVKTVLSNFHNCEISEPMEFDILI